MAEISGLVSMTISGQNDFLECFHSDSPKTSYVLTYLSIMMSEALKVIPQKVSLRCKYLKNNGDSSFQKLAKRLHGCHGNIPEADL